jgi:hypothetical protein
VFYMLTGPDGVAYHEGADGEALPEGAVEVPRLPRLGESWDGETFVLDRVAKADIEYPPSHVSRAHQHKVLEALLIKSGTEVEGILSAEAPMRGLTLIEMADLVLSEAASFIADELARMAAKTAAAVED